MLKAEDIIDGNIYWATAADMESEGYGDSNPRKPYQCKAFWQNNAGGRALKIFRFDETGKIDDDSNASAYIQPSDLYATQAEADLAYKTRVKEKIEELKEEIEGWREKIGEPLDLTDGGPFPEATNDQLVEQVNTLVANAQASGPEISAQMAEAIVLMKRLATRVVR